MAKEHVLLIFLHLTIVASRVLPKCHVDPSQPSCSSDLQCHQGYTCMNGQCCKDKQCPQGMKAISTCKNSPGELKCLPGYMCIDGICCDPTPAPLEASCPSGIVSSNCSILEPCAEGYYCLQGRCCKSNACPDGYRLGPRCNQGMAFQECPDVNDRCINGGCCQQLENTQNKTGSTCTGNIGPKCSSVKDCPAGFVCKGESCCQEHPCQPGWTPGPACSTVPGQNRCPANYDTCENGICCKNPIRDLCLSGRVGPACSTNKSCQTGHTCLKGYCCMDIVCPSNWTKGRACNFAGGEQLCPNGFECVDQSCCRPPFYGKCPSKVLGPKCSPSQKCVPGFNCIDGFCCKDSVCPAGWTEGSTCNFGPDRPYCQPGSRCFNGICCGNPIPEVCHTQRMGPKCSRDKPCIPGYTCNSGYCCRDSLSGLCPTGEVGPTCSFTQPCKPGAKCTDGYCCVDIAKPACPQGWKPGHLCNSTNSCNFNQMCVSGVCCSNPISLECPVNDVGPTCSASKPCKLNYICIKGHCCRNKHDNCPAKWTEGPSCAPTTGGNQCPSKHTCINGTCCQHPIANLCPSGDIGPTCSKANPCKPGYTCLQGYCCRIVVCPNGEPGGPKCNSSPAKNPCAPGSHCFKGYCCRTRDVNSCPTPNPRHVCPRVLGVHGCHADGDCSQGDKCCTSSCLHYCFNGSGTNGTTRQQHTGIRLLTGIRYLGPAKSSAPSIVNKAARQHQNREGQTIRPWTSITTEEPPEVEGEGVTIPTISVKELQTRTVTSVTQSDAPTTLAPMIATTSGSNNQLNAIRKTDEVRTNGQRNLSIDPENTKGPSTVKLSHRSKENSSVKHIDTKQYGNHNPSKEAGHMVFSDINKSQVKSMDTLTLNPNPVNKSTKIVNILSDTSQQSMSNNKSELKSDLPTSGTGQMKTQKKLNSESMLNDTESVNINKSRIVHIPGNGNGVIRINTLPAHTQMLHTGNNNDTEQIVLVKGVGSKDTHVSTTHVYVVPGADIKAINHVKQVNISDHINKVPILNISSGVVMAAERKQPIQENKLTPNVIPENEAHPQTLKGVVGESSTEENQQLIEYVEPEEANLDMKEVALSAHGATPKKNKTLTLDTVSVSDRLENSSYLASILTPVPVVYHDNVIVDNLVSIEPVAKPVRVLAPVGENQVATGPVEPVSGRVQELITPVGDNQAARGPVESVAETIQEVVVPVGNNQVATAPVEPVAETYQDVIVPVGDYQVAMGPVKPVGETVQEEKVLVGYNQVATGPVESVDETVQEVIVSVGDNQIATSSVDPVGETIQEVVVPVGDNQVATSPVEPVAETVQEIIAPVGDKQVATSPVELVAETVQEEIVPVGDNQVTTGPVEPVAETIQEVIAPVGDNQVTTGPVEQVGEPIQEVIAPVDNNQVTTGPIDPVAGTVQEVIVPVGDNEVTTDPVEPLGESIQEVIAPVGDNQLVTNSLDTVPMSASNETSSSSDYIPNDHAAPVSNEIKDAVHGVTELKQPDLQSKGHGSPANAIVSEIQTASVGHIDVITNRTVLSEDISAAEMVSGKTDEPNTIVNIKERSKTDHDKRTGTIPIKHENSQVKSTVMSVSGATGNVVMPKPLTKTTLEPNLEGIQVSRGKATESSVTESISAEFSPKVIASSELMINTNHRKPASKLTDERKSQITQKKSASKGAITSEANTTVPGVVEENQTKTPVLTDTPPIKERISVKQALTENVFEYRPTLLKQPYMIQHHAARVTPIPRPPPTPPPTPPTKQQPTVSNIAGTTRKVIKHHVLHRSKKPKHFRRGGEKGRDDDSENED